MVSIFLVQPHHYSAVLLQPVFQHCRLHLQLELFLVSYDSVFGSSDFDHDWRQPGPFQIGPEVLDVGCHAGQSTPNEVAVAYLFWVLCFSAQYGQALLAHPQGVALVYNSQLCTVGNMHDG